MEPPGQPLPEHWSQQVATLDRFYATKAEVAELRGKVAVLQASVVAGLLAILGIGLTALIRYW